MSALAARRAAAASSGTATPVEQAPTVNGAAAAPSVPKAGPSKRPPRASQDEVYGSSQDSSPKAGPSKRRKIVTNAPRPATVEAMVPAKRPQPVEQSTPLPKSQGNRKGKRAFSPSRPAAEFDEVSSQDGRDSSDEETGVDNSVDKRVGRNIRWSAPSTPGQTPGPSLYTILPPSNNSGQGKTFVAKEGLNVQRTSAVSLGLEGSEEGLLVALKPDESLTLSGTLSITVLLGSISLFSSNLSPSPISHSVFAPTSHPLPVISPARTSNTESEPLLENSKIPSLLTIVVEPSDAVFFLHEISTGIEGLTRGAVPTFGSSFLEHGYQGVLESPPAPAYPYSSPWSWQKALDALTSSASQHGANGRIANHQAEDKPPVILVKGPKRSGKSTFGKAALNTLLAQYEKVAWLECDLGQGEFSAGGVLGIWIIDSPVFGAPFTHPRVPHRAHFLGTYTAISCPDEYLAAIHHLVEVYKYELQYPLDHSTTTGAKRVDALPLIVNTPGWVKGMGEDLLRSIEAMVSATHTFQFPLLPIGGDTEDERPGWTSSPPASYAALAPGPAVEAGVNMELEPAPVLPLQARYAASDHRALSTLAYFYSRLPSPSASDPPRWNFSVPLASQPPYEVELGETIKEVYLRGEGADGILSDDLPLALNGSIVALLGRLSPLPEHKAELYVPARPLPTMDETNFLGYAFIRAVSAAPGPTKLHLLTPLPATTLGRVSIVVWNGAMEMPNAGLIDFPRSQDQGRLPFFDDGPIGVGGERRKIRRNLMRKGA